MSAPNGNPTITIKLELVPQTPKSADPAEVEALGREVAAALRQQGFTVKPAYTGEKGGIVYDFITALTPWAQSAMTNKEILIALFGAAKPVLEYFLGKLKKQPQAQLAGTQTPNLKLSLELPNAKLELEGRDLDEVDGLEQLAERFIKNNPTLAGQVTLQSEVKVKGELTS
jgi:hypothetical protein